MAAAAPSVPHRRLSDRVLKLLVTHILKHSIYKQFRYMLDIYMYIHTHSVSKKWAIDLPVLIPGLCVKTTHRELWMCLKNPVRRNIICTQSDSLWLCCRVRTSVKTFLLPFINSLTVSCAFTACLLSLECFAQDHSCSVFQIA